MRRSKWIAAFGLLAAACGGDGGNGPTSNEDSGAGDVGEVGPAPAGTHQPLKVGATWTYNIVDKGIADTKIVTIQAQEDTGGVHAGVMAYRAEDTTSTGKQLTWYRAEGGIIGRLREVNLDAAGQQKSEHWYEPYLLRLDERAQRLAAGVTWTETVHETVNSQTKNGVETDDTYRFTVEAVDDAVTVPAGSFTCLRLRRQNEGAGSDKTYWFALGVGKVKEVSTNGTEELTSYAIP